MPECFICGKTSTARIRVQSDDGYYSAGERLCEEHMLEAMTRIYNWSELERQKEKAK